MNKTELIAEIAQKTGVLTWTCDEDDKKKG